MSCNVACQHDLRDSFVVFIIKYAVIFAANLILYSAVLQCINQHRFLDSIIFIFGSGIVK